MKFYILNILALLLIVQISASAQSITDYNFDARIDTYETINGGVTLNNEFEDNIPIGFNFDFNGSTFNELGVSERGFVNFGEPNANLYTYPVAQGLSNSLSALSGDLVRQTGSEIRVQTLGTAPNRIFVVQWENMIWNGDNGSYNFQIRLYESTNRIEYHYGNFNPDENNDRVAQISVFGNGADFLNRVIPFNAVWNTNNTQNSNQTGVGIRLRTNAYPTNGLVFSYFPDYSDLSLALSVDAATACLSQELTYQISLNNNGDFNAAGVTIDFDLPAGVTFVSANATQGSYDNSTGLWNVGSIENGNNETLEVIVSIDNDQGGNNLLANASISSSGVIDPDLSNNDSDVSFEVLNNNIPTITNINDQSVPYNGVSSPIPFSISDIETNSNDLILSLQSSNTTLIPISGIQITGTGDDRSLTFTPNSNQFGNSTITLEVSDGICSNSITFEVEVFNQSFVDFQEATIVVGQEDFETVSTEASQTIAPGSNSSAVSTKGVLAVGSQTTNRVLLWNSVPTENGAPANIVVGQANFTNTGENTRSNRLRAPDGVAFSPDGNKLIVADAGNNRILIWNNIPTTNGVDADIVIGQPNFTSRGRGTDVNRFDRPTDIQVTADGKMIVTDRNNHRVLIFNRIPTTNNAEADVVIGQNNFTNDGFATTQNRLRLPWNTSVAPDGKLLIADDGNNRILVFNEIPTTNGANADVVIGQDDFTSRGTGTTPNRLNSPGVTVSPSGVVAIACFNNHRVSIFNEIPTVNGANADKVLGQADFTQSVPYNDGAGNIGEPSNRNMNQPYGINFDLNERLYVNGRAMNRMMIFGETPNQSADLEVSFNSSNSNPCVQSLVSYTVTVTNNGPSNATNVVVTSALPFGYSVEESIIDRGSYNQNSGFWTIPFIGNGESVSLEMIGTVNVGENLNSITAYASVRSYNQFDDDFSNNSGSVTVQVKDNEAPTITELEDVIIDFNESTNPLSFSIADTESPAGNLTVVGSSSDQSLVSDANIVVSGAGADRSVVVTPEADQFGSVTIRLTVEDGTCDSFTEFELFVGNVWLGNTNEWTNASNWSSDNTSETFSAFIPTSPIGGNFPVINSDEVVNNLTISNGARVTINATRNLSIIGDYLNNGNQSTGNGIATFDGNNQQSVSGIIGNMTIANPNGVVMIGNTAVQGTLNLQDGEFNVGNNMLTLRNPIAGTIANFNTQANSSIAIEGSAGGINLPVQVNQLENLSLNNGSGLSLNNDLNISGQLDLSAGPLRIGNNTLTLNGNVSSTSGNLSADPTSNLIINGSGNAGTLRINSIDNLFNNVSLNRNTEGQIIVPDDIKIGGVLNISSGKWITQNGQVQLENDDPNALQGYDTNNYIVGNLRRCVSAGNRYEFPIGTLDNITLSSIYVNSLSSPTCLNASFTEGLTGAPPQDLEINDNAIDDVLNYGFWTINQTTTADVNYDINLISRGHNNGGIASENHAVIKRDNDASSWSVLGEFSDYNISGSENDPISISRANLDGFSDFGIGVSSEGPLPVELVSFTAKKDFDGIHLKWTTASEKNNEYFEIERGKDLDNMEIIGLVQGQGTKKTETNYKFKDRSTQYGKIYYRLRQVDYDGKSERSPVVLIKLPDQNQTVQLYPIPVKDKVNLIFNKQNVKTVAIQIFDANGKQVFQQKSDVSQIGNPSIDLQNLSSGMYQFKIYSETEEGMVIENGKLIKK